MEILKKFKNEILLVFECLILLILLLIKIKIDFTIGFIFILLFVPAVFFLNSTEYIIYFCLFAICFYSGYFINNKNFLLILFFIASLILIKNYIFDIIKKKKAFHKKWLIPFCLMLTYVVIISISNFDLLKILFYLACEIFIFILCVYAKDLKFNYLIYSICVGIILSGIVFPIHTVEEMYGLVTNRICGLAGHPQIYAMICLIGISGLLILKLKDEINNIAFFILFFGLFILGYKTISRVFLAAVAIALAFFYIFYFKKYKSKSILFLSLTFIGLLLSLVIAFKATYYFLCRFSYRTNFVDTSEKELTNEFVADLFSGKEYYDPGRLGIWKLYIYRIFNPISILFFGKGVCAPYIGQEHAHNFILNGIYIYGLVGIALHLWFYYWAMDIKKMKIKENLPYFLIYVVPFAIFMMLDINYPIWIFLFAFVVFEKNFLNSENK